MNGSVTVSYDGGRLAITVSFARESTTARNEARHGFSLRVFS